MFFLRKRKPMRQWSVISHHLTFTPRWGTRHGRPPPLPASPGSTKGVRKRRKQWSYLKRPVTCTVVAVQDRLTSDLLRKALPLAALILGTTPDSFQSPRRRSR